MSAIGRVAWIPRYTEAAASSRLRVFALAKHVGGHVLGGSCPPSLPENTQVLIVQKAVDPAVFDLAEKFAAGGGTVVYDFDDIMSHETIARAAKSASLFTVDTPQRGHWLVESLRKSARCAVIPDCIDYDPLSPWPASEASHQAVWFGNAGSGNFGPTSRWLAETLHRNVVSVRTITECPVDPFLWVKWGYKDFATYLRWATVAILAHEHADPAKSENKMVAAITLGLPCIVSGSSSYAALAERCGVGWCVVSNEQQLREAWARLQDVKERQAYLDAAQPLIWKEYHASRVAAKLVNVLESIR